jgi:hypothetical protein
MNRREKQYLGMHGPAVGKSTSNIAHEEKMEGKDYDSEENPQKQPCKIHVFEQGLRFYEDPVVSICVALDNPVRSKKHCSVTAKR